MYVRVCAHVCSCGGFLMQQVTCFPELNVYFLLDGTGCQFATFI